MELLLVVLGFLTLVTSIVLSRYFPNKETIGKMPIGFSSPILAFEFIRSQQELTDLFNISPPARRKQVIDNVNIGNRIDVGFAILYSLLAACSAYFLLRLAKLPEPWQTMMIGASVVLALTAGICDVLENTILLTVAGPQLLTINPRQLNRLTSLVTTKFTTLTLSLALTLPYWLLLIQDEILILKIWAGITAFVILIALVGTFLVLTGWRTAAQWLLMLQISTMVSTWSYTIFLLINS